MKIIWNTEYSNGRYFLWLVFLCVGQFQKYAPILMVKLNIYWKLFFPMKIIKRKIFMPIWALGNFLTHLSEIGNPLKLRLRLYCPLLSLALFSFKKSRYPFLDTSEGCKRNWRWPLKNAFEMRKKIMCGAK